MVGRRPAATALVLLAATLGGCAIEGTPTWPGARLDSALLTAADFPSGVQFDRIVDRPGRPDGAGGPPAMLSRPEGCTDGLTNVIAASAERGPGSAAKYSVAYDGARVLMTVLSSNLDTNALAETAIRCAKYLAFFDPPSPGIPITTTKLPSERQDALVYRQTMKLLGVASSVYFSFENVGSMAVFGLAFPTPDPTIPVEATLPQTFLDISSKQAERLESH